jgi:hypothetical protein
MTEPSSRAEVPSRHGAKDRTVRLSLALLLLAGGVALAKALGGGPAHLQTGEIQTFYVAVLAYEYAAVPVTCLIFLAWVFLVVAAIRRFRQPAAAARRIPLVALGVTSLALLTAGFSTLQQLFVGYRHLESVTTGADDYHLGVRTALDGDFFFVVTECPHGQQRCTAYGVAAVNVDEHAEVPNARLTVDSTAQTLLIQTASRTIPFGFTPR